MLRRLFTSRRHAAALGVAASVLVGDARAHIDLSSPEPREHGRGREPNSNLKQGPCGQEVNGRTDKVTVLEPGATVSVTWVETTNHRSYYRVAFDVDGDDAFPTFAGTGRGAQGVDPTGPCPVDGQVILAYDMDDRAGGSHTLEVRLPDVECERCTLQVVQFMFDTMRPYYFQCADLALRRPRSAGDVGSDTVPSDTVPSDTVPSDTVPSDTVPSDDGPFDAGGRDAAAPAAGEDAGAVSSPRAAPGCWSQIAPSESVPAPSGDDDGDDAEPAPTAPPAAAAGGSASTAAPNARRSDDSGCSLAPGSTRSNAARHLPLIGAWAVWRRRQRRVRRCERSTPRPA